MTFDKLRLSIFEAYQNEEISRETCENMLESVTDMEGDHIVSEAESIRADFMGVALECANGNVEFAAFEKQAETFGDKVKAVWEKFKKWVAGIVNAIKKKVCPKQKISVSEEFMKFVDKATNMVNSIKANADLVTVAKSVLALVGSVGGIFVGKKMVTKYKDEVHKKLVTAADGVRKVVDDLTAKLPKSLQESGIMKALRDVLNKITTSDNAIIKAGVKGATAAKNGVETAAGAVAGAAKTAGGAVAGAAKTAGGAVKGAADAVADKADSAANAVKAKVTGYDHNALVDEYKNLFGGMAPAKGMSDARILEKIEQQRAANNSGEYDSGELGESFNGFADGTVFGESTDEDFDLDAMLADLDI